MKIVFEMMQTAGLYSFKSPWYQSHWELKRLMQKVKQHDKIMSDTNRLNGLGNMRPAKPNLIKPGQTLKRLHRAFDPTCAFYLAKALPGNRAGLPPGSLHHVAGMNFMAEMVELVHPETQRPPVYFAGFADVEIVARNDNPKAP